MLFSLARARSQSETAAPGLLAQSMTDPRRPVALFVVRSIKVASKRVIRLRIAINLRFSRGVYRNFEDFYLQATRQSNIPKPWPCRS